MGYDETFEHSIPNAWMASTPFHPFFMLPLEGIVRRIDQPEAQESVEWLTGPIALRDRLIDYHDEYDDGRKLVEYLGENSMNKTYFDGYNLLHSVTVFPPEIIFPFSWMMSAQESGRTHCVGGGGLILEREICKDELRVRENGGYCITYWSHTWNAIGHSEEGMAGVMKGTRRRG